MRDLLIFDLDGSDRGEELLDQIVLFVVQRRPAQARQPYADRDINIMPFGF